MKNFLKSVFILFGVVAIATLATNSYFSSQASVVGNQFNTGTWTPSPTPSVSDTIRICHATGQEGHYQSISPNANGVINGHVGVSHQEGRDIIPPFDYGNPIEHFLGQNWDTFGQAIWNNDCETPAQPSGLTISPSPSPSILPTPTLTPLETSPLA